MILSKTTVHAIRVLNFMAMEDYPLYSANLLNEKLDIPLRYLRRLLTDLSKHDFIKSLKGRNGGFEFKKKLEEIYLSDIIDAIEGFESFDSCLLGNYQCDLENPCPMHTVWAETKEKMINTFTTTSLADIKDQYVE